MDRKKIFVGLLSCAILLGAGIIISTKFSKNFVTNNEEISAKNIEKKSVENKKTGEKMFRSYTGKENVKTDMTKDNTEPETKSANLFPDTDNNTLSLSSITEITKLPQNIQDKIKTIIEKNNGIYMISQINDKVIIVSDNPQNIRHGIEFTEISTVNGQQKDTTLAYNDKIKDSDNDIWEYDNNQKPTKHTKYDKNGDIEFVEIWNYSPEESVKYEMKDGEGNVLSIRKETTDDNVNLRIENLIYDKNGKTKINVSTTYEGADIKRFTYYNADNPEIGGAIFSEYENGEKTKETLYTSDLKVKNVYKAEYKDGNRDKITVYNDNNNEILILKEE